MHVDERAYQSNELPWVPVELMAKGKAFIKVIITDRERKKVVFRFRMEPGSVMLKHTHHCHAIAYTISGEWEYDGIVLPEGAIAYEPFDSTHTPASRIGADIIVTFHSPDEIFLINHVPGGENVIFDMAFFEEVQKITPEAAREISARLEAAE